MFVNPAVDVDSLPGVVDLDWQPLSPSFVTTCQLGATALWLGIGATIAVAHLVYNASDAPSPIPTGVVLAVWAAFVLLAAWAIAWPVIDVPRRGYVVRDMDIAFRKGVLWRTTVVVPYSRVQHAETGNGPIDRFFDLSYLVVYTAGGVNTKIEGLHSSVAERLRGHVLMRARELTEPGAPEDTIGDTEDRSPAGSPESRV